MPIALYALTVGAFGIGVTEFVIMGLLLQVSADLGVSIPVAGLLMSGYALGVFVGAPILTIATRSLPRSAALAICSPRQNICAASKNSPRLRRSC